MARRKFGRRVYPLNVLFLICVAYGCVPLKQFTHSPRLSVNLHRLQIGQTTRGEVFQYYGFPDIEAERATNHINSDGPLARFWDHFRTDREWMRSFPYSSIDDQHVTYLYLEVEIKGSFELERPDLYFGAIASSYKSTILKNKLLIRLNKNTGVVANVSYTEEFP